MIRKRPRTWAHNKVEGNIEYTSLLYLPKRAPFDLFEREQKGGIQLYVKRVFIMDKAAELVPPYLALHARTGRFIGPAPERVARAAAK